jgi:hypothetical protein
MAAQVFMTGALVLGAIFIVLFIGPNVVLPGLIVAAIPSWISYRKGKTAFALLGLVFPIFAIVGACRVAKPGSPWAEKRYGHAKLAQSWERYERTPYKLSS